MLNNRASEIALRKIKSLYPLCELSDEHHPHFIRAARLTRLEAGTQIAADTSAEHLTFLIDGDLSIVSSKGEMERLTGGKPRASFPLFKLHSPELFARSNAPSLLLQFDRQQYEAIKTDKAASDSNRQAAIVLSSDGAEYNLLQELLEKYASGKLKLPSLPDVAFKIHRAIDDESVGAREIAQIVITDPTLSAKLIQVANSPAYRGNVRITTVQDAITRLGLKTAQSLTLSLSIEKLFNTSSGIFKKSMQEIYSHSLLVGCLSYVIAKQTGRLNPERALLAGLLHDLGKIVILTNCHKSQLSRSDGVQLETLMGQFRGVAGNIILSSMEFEHDMITVAEEAESWWRDSGEALDYCDVVIIAQLHSFIGTPMLQRVPHMDTLPAFKKLNLGEFDPKHGLQLLRDANNVVQNLRQMLS